MAKYVVHWFNLDTVVHSEPPIDADSESDAEKKIMSKYPVDKRPAAMCKATKL